MKKHYMENALIGMGIGFPITLACMTLIGGFNAVMMEFLVWMVASALYGMISGAMFYTKNDLPLPAAMALHCLGCLIVTVAAAAICSYSDSVVALVLNVLPVFVVIYVLVYGFCIFLMKKNEKQINQALSEK